jgi:hypothetical protein
LGIRSNVETSAAAFIGGVEQALPHFTKDSGICSSLEDIIGDFKEDNSRWTKLIQSGCRTGFEFQNSWETMKREIQELSLEELDRGWFLTLESNFHQHQHLEKIRSN